MGRSSRCRACLGVCFPCCFVTGLMFIGLGLGFYLKFPDIETQQINKKVTVEEGHATFEQLKAPSIAIYKDFYFFNLTNAEEFHSKNGGVKPNLTEIGPYSYREYRNKTFKDKGPDPDQRSYTQKKIFYFSKDTSKPGVSETDKICTINIPMVAAISTAENASPWLAPFLKFGVWVLIDTSKAKLFTCQNASHLAWNYTDPLLDKLHAFHQYPSKYVNIQVNNSVNDSLLSTIHTGVSNITKIGEFVQWDGKKRLTTWNNCEADEIRGTEGFFFRPNLKERDNLTAFVDDIQRSVDLVYLTKVQPLGLSAFRYGIDNRTFKSAFSEPENARWRSWCPDGMFYLGPTQPKEIPVFGSKPHFLDGDPLLLDSVVGLEPNRFLHDTVIDVEPTTGANLNFQRQLQINVQVNRTKKHRLLKEMSEVDGYNHSGVLYYPVLYINEHATMDQDFKDYLENNGLHEIGIFNIVVPVLFGVLLFAGVVCLLIAMFTCAAFISRSRASRDEARTPLLNPSA